MSKIWVVKGCDSFEPSRYSAFAFNPSNHDAMNAALQSATVASFGILMVFEIAPEMKGWAAAIIRMWLSTER